MPLVAGLLSFAVGEYVLSRRSAKAKTALWMHFVIDMLSALAATLAVTQAIKVVVGRLRPNFLAACNPVTSNPTNVTAWGQPASNNPACTADTSSSMVDEHYSFPSGHTSTGVGLGRQLWQWQLWQWVGAHRPLHRG